ncbi:predicted protein [Streptomyces sp. AA4]|nr:predicted protein [Streptomyces sp. AA4]
MRLILRLAASLRLPSTELAHARPVHERTRHRRIRFERNVIAETRKPRQALQQGAASRDLTHQTRGSPNPNDRLLDETPGGRPPAAKPARQLGQFPRRLPGQTSTAFRCGA